MQDPKSNKDSSFDNAWFSRTPASESASAPAKKISPVQRSIEEIKEYAYGEFDRLDANGNGYVELNELVLVLQDPDTPMRDKSFVSFLINNHDDIQQAYDEGSEKRDGISRLDLEFYFRLVISQLK